MDLTPFGNMSLSYSMWPLVLTTYNLPPWVYMKESSFMLTVLILGSKSPGKDMDVFLRPIVDELKDLWEWGVQTCDVVDNNVFNMRATLMWTVNDFPARSSLSRWSGQGYKACLTCNKDTPSIRVISKEVYIGYRRFLPRLRPLRNNKEIDGKIERRQLARRLSVTEILDQLNQVRP